jgi:hypothetical protein
LHGSGSITYKYAVIGSDQSHSPREVAHLCRGRQDDGTSVCQTRQSALLKEELSVSVSKNLFAWKWDLSRCESSSGSSSGRTHRIADSVRGVMAKVLVAEALWLCRGRGVCGWRCSWPRCWWLRLVAERSGSLVIRTGGCTSPVDLRALGLTGVLKARG